MDLENSRIHPDYIAAFLMLLIVFKDIITSIESIDVLLDTLSLYTLEFFLSTILCFVGALVLLFTKHRSIVKTMMVTSIVFAIISLDDSFNSLLIVSEYLDYNLINFFIGAAQLIFGLMLIGNIIIYWTKASASLDGMLLSMAGILCLNIINDLTMIRIGLEPLAILKTELAQLPVYALMVFDIILLSSDSVKVHTMVHSVMQSSDDIKRFATPVGVKIDRSLIPKLNDIAVSGLSEGSYEVELNSFYPVDYKLVFTKNGDKTLVSFCSLEDNSGTGLARFNLKGIWLDTGDAGTCDLIRIYGDDMFFIQLIVGGPYEKSVEKVSIVEAFKG